MIGLLWTGARGVFEYALGLLEFPNMPSTSFNSVSQRSTPTGEWLERVAEFFRRMTIRHNVDTKNASTTVFVDLRDLELIFMIWNHPFDSSLLQGFSGHFFGPRYARRCWDRRPVPRRVTLPTLQRGLTMWDVSRCPHPESQEFS